MMTSLTANKLTKDERYDVLGVRVSATNLDLASETISAWIKNKEKQYVCVAPVSTIVECQHDDAYRKIVNDAGMVTPDGMPVVWLGKMQRVPDLERTYGPDLLLKLCGLSKEREHRHYFYGGNPQSNDRLIKVLKRRFPGIHIAGTYVPRVLKIKEKETADVIQAINQAKPDILWVGLGSPKQDQWMVDHRDELDVPVIIGVGAAFDFVSGMKKQAPRWMQKAGLEWFFRLCSEPKRLWKRYLVGNTQFLYYLIVNWFKQLFIRKPKHDG